MLFWGITASQAHIAEIDSLKRILDQTIHDTTRVDILIGLGWKYRNKAPDTAFQYLDSSLALSLRIHYKSGEAKSLYGQGVLHQYQGDYTTALELFFKSLRIIEQREFDEETPALLNSIGTIYWYQRDLDASLEYYQKSLEVSTELGDSLGIANVLANLGMVSASHENYDRAIGYFQQALGMKKSLNDLQGVGRNLNNIGGVYYFQKKYEKAIDFYIQSLNVKEALDDKKGMAGSLNNIGQLYFKIGNNEKAREYYERSLTIAYLVGDKFIRQGVHESLANVASAQNDYKGAYEHYKRHVEIKDSLFNEDKSKEIGKLEAKYEFEKAEEERARAMEKKRIAEKQEKSRRDNLQYSAILIFIILLFTAAFTIGKLSIPTRVMEGLTFFAFLLFFEFLLVLLDPYIEQHSGGEPAYKLFFNALLAGLIFPLHSFFESRAKRRLY